MSNSIASSTCLKRGSKGWPRSSSRRWRCVPRRRNLKPRSPMWIAVDNLSLRFDQLISDTTSATKHSGSHTNHPEPVLGGSELPPLCSASATAHLVASSMQAASGPNGHRVKNQNWGPGFGMVYAISTPPPVTGAKKFSNPSPVSFDLESPSHHDQSGLSHLHHAFPS